MGLCLGLALVLTTAGAWGQDRRQPASDSFRVTWQPRATGVVPTIEGRVYNASLVWVTDVRLQVEGLDPGATRWADGLPGHSGTSCPAASRRSSSTPCRSGRVSDHGRLVLRWCQ
jgi:hypothetical protein